MIDNQRFRDMIGYLKSNRYIRNQQDFVERTSSDKATVSQIMNDKLNISNNVFENIRLAFPFISIDWLKTGSGEMLLDVQPEIHGYEIPLLPVQAHGGSLTDFEESVFEYECEKVISPIREAKFALTITGDSMSPEYPCGSMVLVKQINERAFIEWGKVYVLDTCNGVVIKQLMPHEDPSIIRCVSLNDNYPPFDIPLNYVRSVYKVLLCMSMK